MQHNTISFTTDGWDKTGRHFADDIYKSIFLDQFWYFSEIYSKRPINKTTGLV